MPSDPEKPGTPGEGVLSSDLDRIPTEGETCVMSCVCQGPPREGRPHLEWVWIALACVPPWPRPVPLWLCQPVLLSSAVCVPCRSPSDLPKMESKDLQQLFKDVLGSEREQHLGCGTPGLEGSRTPLQRPFLQGAYGRAVVPSLLSQRGYLGGPVASSL